MTLQIGDIVQRADNGRRFVVVGVSLPWIYTRQISGRTGTPGVITFPSQRMLRKVA